MTYLFHHLDKFCNALNFSVNHPQGAACLTTSFRAETEKIRKQLKDIYFRPDCQLNFPKFITLHHTTLVELLDKLPLPLGAREGSEVLNSAQSHDHAEAMLSAYAQLSELLEFIHTHFSNFIPRHLLIPRQSLSTPTQEVADGKEFIELVLSSPRLIELKNLILQPFDDFLEGTNKHTGHNLFYCRALHTELKWLTENVLPDTESLIWMLYRLNYNHPSFYTLLTNYILQLDAGNYLQTLYGTKRKIRQLLMIPHLVYTHDHAPIGELLENWLKEEIAYTRKAAKLHITQPAESSLPEKEPAEKIEANMSVAELACLFKALSDSGLIKIPNYTDFFHSIASNYRTRQSPNLSADSFRNKFYSAEPGIRNTVKQHVIALMNQINLNA